MKVKGRIFFFMKNRKNFFSIALWSIFIMLSSHDYVIVFFESINFNIYTSFDCKNLAQINEFPHLIIVLSTRQSVFLPGLIFCPEPISLVSQRKSRSQNSSNLKLYFSIRFFRSLVNFATIIRFNLFIVFNEYFYDETEIPSSSSLD